MCSVVFDKSLATPQFCISGCASGTAVRPAQLLGSMEAVPTPACRTSEVGSSGGVGTQPNPLGGCTAYWAAITSVRNPTAVSGNPSAIIGGVLATRTPRATFAASPPGTA